MKFSDEFRMVVGSEQNDIFISEPEIITIVDSEKKKSSYLCTPIVNNSIAGLIGLKRSLSNSLFKEAPDLWKTLYERKISESDINLSSYNYITYQNNMIIDRFDQSSSMSFIENLNKFSDSMDNYTVESVFDVSGTIKYVLKENEESNDVIILSLNISRSWYYLNHGYYTSDGILVCYKPSFETPSFREFIEGIDFNIEFNSLKTNMKLNIVGNIDRKLSLREVLDLLKDCSCKVGLDENKFADVIECVKEKNSRMFVEFLNSFNMPYKSLKKLKYIKKFFRYNELTFRDILIFLTDEFMNNNISVSTYTISNIIGNLVDTEIDITDVNKEISTNSSVLM